MIGRRHADSWHHNGGRWPGRLALDGGASAARPVSIRRADDDRRRCARAGPDRRGAVGGFAACATWSRGRGVPAAPAVRAVGQAGAVARSRTRAPGRRSSGFACAAGGSQAASAGNAGELAAAAPAAAAPTTPSSSTTTAAPASPTPAPRALSGPGPAGQSWIRTRSTRLLRSDPRCRCRRCGRRRRADPSRTRELGDWRGILALGRRDC